MLDTTLDEVFEVMRRRHVAYLGDRRSVQRLLTALGGGNVSVSSLDLLANEVVVAVGEASGRQALARVEANMAALAMTLRSGTGNIAQEVVDQLVAAGQAERIADIALLPTAYADTKLRQLAVFLIDRRLADVVSRFVDRIANNAERRSVGYSCLASIRGSSTDAAASQLLMSVYKSVRDPQRRNLRDRAAELGLQLRMASGTS